jgi:polyhydroxyalkanoate synthesis regulator protein
MLLTRISECAQLARMTAKKPVLIERLDDQRFYDVGLGRFLTIDDLVAWQAMSVSFKVRDAKTAKDVTEVVLAEARRK